MKQVVGIKNLTDEFRRAKIIAGDLRGLKNAITLSERLGVNAMQTLFFMAGGNGGYKIEVYADITRDGEENSSWSYSMKDMVEEIEFEKKHGANKFEIIFYYCKWNKKGTDCDRLKVNMENIDFYISEPQDKGIEKDAPTYNNGYCTP